VHSVVVGQHDQKDYASLEDDVYAVQQIVYHPKYDDDKNQYDIALVELDVSEWLSFWEPWMKLFWLLMGKWDCETNHFGFAENFLKSKNTLRDKMQRSYRRNELSLYEKNVACTLEIARACFFKSQPFITTGIGLRQGCVLLPLFFIVCMNCRHQ